jgi:hypothetical protein
LRYLPISLTLVGFTVAAGLAGCGSDAPSPTGTSGNGPVAGSSPGGAGKPGTPTAGSGGGPVVGGAGAGTVTGGSSTGGSSTGGSGTAGSSTAGGNSTAGSTSGGAPGTSGSGPVAGGGNAMAGAGSDVDKNGKTNAKPGDKTSTKLDYLKLGEIRLINNNWGSVAYNCTDKSPSSVFVNADKTFGWSFDRPDCDTGNNKDKPDFPELEFGIHPFNLARLLLNHALAEAD